MTKNNSRGLKPAGNKGGDELPDVWKGVPNGDARGLGPANNGGGPGATRVVDDVTKSITEDLTNQARTNTSGPPKKGRGRSTRPINSKPRWRISRITPRKRVRFART
jgi:hypothetical protein